MRIKSTSHVYETLPPYLNNRTLKDPAEQVVVGLAVATMPEQDAHQRELLMIRAEYALDKAQELMEEKLRDLVAAKFRYCRGLVIEGVNDDGRDLTWDELYRHGPPELVGWIIRAVMSSTELTLAERKNFVPASA